MKDGTTLLLFLVGAFALIAALLEIPGYAKYTGLFFVYLFLGALIIVWWSTVRDGKKFAKEQMQRETNPASQSSAS